MKNPWVTYLLLRVGLFAAILVGFLLLGIDSFAAAVFAAALSLAISLLFFSRQRNAVSEAITQAVEKRKKFGQTDEDSDVENELLDKANETQAAEGKPGDPS